jgi:predicted neutral ceramidase superfamily lipid hydrolase
VKIIAIIFLDSNEIVCSICGSMEAELEVVGRRLVLATSDFPICNYCQLNNNRAIKEEKHRLKLQRLANSKKSKNLLSVNGKLVESFQL